MQHLKGDPGKIPPDAASEFAIFSWSDLLVVYAEIVGDKAVARSSDIVEEAADDLAESLAMPQGDPLAESDDAADDPWSEAALQAF